EQRDPALAPEPLDQPLDRAGRAPPRLGREQPPDLRHLAVQLGAVPELQPPDRVDERAELLDRVARQRAVPPPDAGQHVAAVSGPTISAARVAPRDAIMAGDVRVPAPDRRPAPCDRP